MLSSFPVMPANYAWRKNAM